jgi:AAA15 family ATPase/GTPase
MAIKEISLNRSNMMLVNKPNENADFLACLDLIYTSHELDKVYGAIKSNPKLLEEYDKNGYTLIHWLAENNKISTEHIQKLREDNITFDLDVPTHDPSMQCTPLHLVIIRQFGEETDYFPQVEALINLGADIHKTDTEGATPLHYAARYSTLSILKLLGEKGAIMTAKDHKGRTPLHYAVEAVSNIRGTYIDKKDTIRFLCPHKGSSDIQDNEGQTPLHELISFANKSKERGLIDKFFIGTITTLREVGACEMMANHRKQTPVDIDQKGLLKNLPASHPIKNLAFTGNLIPEISPSLKNAQEWKDIPKFAIITGRNGSGKTHILNYAAVYLKKLESNTTFIYKTSKLASEDNSPPVPGVDSSKLVSSFSHTRSRLVSIFQDYVQKKADLTNKYRQLAYSDKLFSAYCLDRTLVEDNTSYRDFMSLLKDEDELKKLLNKIVEKESGPAPWEKLNTLLEKLKPSSINGQKLLQVNYDSNDPTIKSVRFKLTHQGQEEFIEAEKLSSGEALILEMFSWQYLIERSNSGAAEKTTVQKVAIMLLDEPDRHFDPELSKLFMDCLKDEIVKNSDIQVIMTTHRTDTLALIDNKDNDTGIFIIEKDDKDIANIKPTNRLQALFNLTPNLRDLTNFHIKVCVEAFDDVMFYEKVYNQLLRLCEQHRKAKTKLTFTLDLDTTPRQCKEILSRRFQLSFYSVALTREGAKGGDAMVLRAVQGEKLAVQYTQQIGIKALFNPSMRYPLGLIDADAHIANGTDPQGKITTDFDEIKDQIRFTKRHTLENYLYDPVVLFSALDEQAIDDLISNEHTKLKDLAKGCHVLLTRGVSSSGQDPFEAYFRYFIEELIKGDKNGEIHKKQYLEIYQYVNPGKKFGDKVEKFNVLKELKIDLSTSLGRPIAKKEVIDELLKKDAKKISILSSNGVECLIIQYPGLFIKARGHNLEEFFAGKTIFAKTEHNPRVRATAFKRELIKRMITSPDIHLPADLVEVLFELNSKARTQANSVIKS